MSQEERQPIVNGNGSDDLKSKTTATTASVCSVYLDGVIQDDIQVRRFIALFFMCLLGFGSSFCYDNPGALQDVFKTELDINATQFTLIYSIYSWPSVFFCFIGGFLMDRVFGIHLGTLIFTIVLLIGQLFFALGGFVKIFWLLIFGRFIFGIGAESLAVAQNNYAVLWFSGKELNMVFGLQLSFARLGSTFNFWIVQPIYKYVSQYYHSQPAVGIVLFLSSTTCVVSVLCALILGWMDMHVERSLQRKSHAPGKIAKLTDIFTFKLTFWLVSVICVAYYVAIFPFIALGQAFFMDNFGTTAEEANNISSVIYLISAIASPFFGFIIDQFGRNIYWVFTATITTMLAHIILTFTLWNPYIGVSLMGISYSMLAASLWPLVALIVPEYQLGSAYGFCQSVQNLGLAVISILAGMILDYNMGNHLWLQLLFISWLLIALLATMAIWIYDKRRNGNLNMTPFERERHNSFIDDGWCNSTNAVFKITDREPLLRSSR